MAKRTQRHTAQANKRSCTWFWAWIGLLALASLVACSPAGPSLEREPTAAGHSGQVVDQGTTKATEPRPKNTPTVAPTVPNPLDSTLQAMIERAKADLARQLDVETSQITVVETESVEWRDSSLGCPQPGMMYAQVITPGYRIVLEAEGKTYEYHTDQRQTVVLCSQENPDSATAQGAWPIYVQMVQVLLPPGSSLDGQLTDPAPNTVFHYDPDSQILLLRPSIDVRPEAQVLIGQTTTIGGPGQTPTRGELFQIPPDETSPLDVIAVDAETGALTLAYAGQVYNLLPGQSRSLKRATDQATEITTITNTGRLAAIEPFPYSPDAR